MINNSHFITFPNLTTNRLKLRQFDCDKDAEFIYMDNYKHVSIKESKQFIEKNLKTYSDKKGIFWVIELIETGETIGDFAFWKVDQQHKRGEIGYALLPKFWGKGYMNECIQTTLNFGFNDLNLHSIEANINPKNEKSRQLLLNLGFCKEAYFKENYYFNGNFIDSEIYSLLESNSYRKK